MKRKLKCRLWQFYEYDAVAEDLAAMAAKGWELEKVGYLGWHFCRTEPKQKTFAVTYFDRASDFDPAPGEAQLTYMDFCRRAGWEPVAQWAQMQIFSTDRPDPVPLETEEAVRLENIHRAMQKSYLPGMWCVLALSAVQVLLQCRILSQGLFDWLLGIQPLMFLLWITMALCTGWKLWQYRRWYRGSQSSVAEGGGCLPGRSPGGRAAERVLLTVDFAVLALLLAMALRNETVRFGLLAGAGILAAIDVPVLGVKALLKRKGVAASVNRTVTLLLALALPVAVMAAGAIMLPVISGTPDTQYVSDRGRSYLVSQDEIPLRVGDLPGKEPGKSFSYENRQEGLFFQRTYCSEDHVPEDGAASELSYELLDVSVPCFFSYCLRDRLDLTKFNETLAEEDGDGPYAQFLPSDPAPWQADAAYRRETAGVPDNVYVIVWGRRIVTIRTTWTLTEAQMAAAAEKLST